MNSERILNINDNETSRYTLSRMLQHAGFEVMEAENGLQGIELAQSCHPAVILLDIKLPDIDGIEVCRRLKARHECGRVPVVHITAHAFSTDKKIESLEGGADAYLTFPVERSYLVSMVRSLIRLAHAEEEREEYLQNLRQTNREHVEALGELRDQKALTEKFVATLSHDLRNPLAAIRLAAQLVQRKIDKNDPIAGHVEKILDSTDRADRMIEDLLDAGMLQPGQHIPLTAAAADLREIAQETIEDFTGRYGERFVLICPTPIQGDRWDPRAIRRVIENLLQNAVKYGSEQKPISVVLTRLENSVRISVHNWGNPIGEQDRRDLFERYLRLRPRRTARDERSWGLGLAMVHSVVEAHGGSVQVDSSEERGTTFTVELPTLASTPH